jgi:hypothetical protein
MELLIFMQGAALLSKAMADPSVAGELSAALPRLLGAQPPTAQV